MKKLYRVNEYSDKTAIKISCKQNYLLIIWGDSCIDKYCVWQVFTIFPSIENRDKRYETVTGNQKNI